MRLNYMITLQTKHYILDSIFWRTKDWNSIRVTNYQYFWDLMTRIPKYTIKYYVQSKKKKIIKTFFDKFLGIARVLLYVFYTFIEKHELNYILKYYYQII